MARGVSITPAAAAAHAGLRANYAEKFCNAAPERAAGSLGYRKCPSPVYRLMRVSDVIDAMHGDDEDPVIWSFPSFRFRGKPSRNGRSGYQQGYYAFYGPMSARKLSMELAGEC